MEKNNNFTYEKIINSPLFKLARVRLQQENYKENYETSLLMKNTFVDILVKMKEIVSLADKNNLRTQLSDYYKGN